MIALRQGETMHFVNGRQLCERQYSQYRYDQAVDDTLQFIKTQILAIGNAALDDRDFRERVVRQFL